MEKEIWRPVVGYEGLYKVSNLGRVKSLGNDRKRKEKILKSSKVSSGYLGVRLSKNGVGKTITIHHIVAQAFIPNPDNLPCINHKDECKTNNQVSNLEWCTAKYNAYYSKVWLNGNEVTRKPVLQFTKSGEFVAEYQSARESERQTGIKQGNISRCCLGKYGFKSAGGFIWRYKE